MPELPEVETIRKSLAAKMIGRSVIGVQVRDRRLRRPVDGQRLHNLVVGRRIEAVRRRAKYLLIDLTGGSTLVLHLGMSGRLLLLPELEAFAVHDHIIFNLDDHSQLRLRDHRRFGMVEALEEKDLSHFSPLQGLGVEPLSAECSGVYLHRRSRGLKKPVKNFLMDAHIMVGVGNIYANEALFLAGINPRRAAGKLSLKAWESLTAKVKQVLDEAIAQGGTTLNDFRNSDGKTGYFQVFLRVYGRAGEKCLNCKKVIRRKVMAGRSTFYCPGCQG